MIPRIKTRDDLHRVIQMAKYPPDGERGSAQGRGYTRFLSGDVVSVMGRCNEESLMVAQIGWSRGEVEEEGEIEGDRIYVCVASN